METVETQEHVLHDFEWNVMGDFINVKHGSIYMWHACTTLRNYNIG